MSLKTRTIRGAFWVTLGMTASNLLSYLITLILARLLTPDDFGLMAIANLIIYTLGIVRSMGLSQALIYKSESIERLADTALTLVTSFGVLAFLAALLSAPFIASLFNEVRAISLIQALAVTLLLSSASQIPEAFLISRLEFKRKFISDNVPFIAYAMVALGLAALDLGVWSLVIGRIAESGIRAWLSWQLIGWRPKVRFEWMAAKEILLYGKDLTASSILAILFLNIDNAFISRLSETSQLGYYTFAFSLATVPVLFAQRIADTVTFPAYVQIRDQRETIRRGYLKSLRLVVTFAFPINMGLIAIAPVFVPILYGDKWNPSITLIQILSLYGIARAIGGTPSTILRSIGKQYLLPRFIALYLAIAAASLGPAIHLCGTVGAAMVMTMLISIGSFVWLLLANHYLEISLNQLMRVIAPQGFAAILMVIIVLFASSFLGLSLVALVSLIGLGVVIYAVTLIIATRGEAIDDIKEIIQPVITYMGTRKSIRSD